MLTGRLSGGSRVMSRSRRTIRPDVGSSNPPIIRRVVVLPHPDGPRREKNSPGRTSRETPSTARTSPKRFSRSMRRISAAATSLGVIIGRPEPTFGRWDAVQVVPPSATSPRALRDARKRALPIGIEGLSRLVEIDRQRSVIRRHRRALARLAIDLRVHEPIRGVRAGQEQVDAHPEVLVEHARTVVPPREPPGLVMAGAVGVDQAPV